MLFDSSQKLGPLDPESRPVASASVGETIYFDQTATVIAIVVAVLWTSHLLSPLGIIVKQLGLAWVQVVQNPLSVSFHVPLSLLPGCSTSSRVIFPSGVNIILNLEPEGAAAANGSPLKKVFLISLGAMGSVAKAPLARQNVVTRANGPRRPALTTSEATKRT